MAIARICERCGAVFPLSSVCRNRVMLCYYNPEETNLKAGTPVSADRVDLEICHNCMADLETFLKIEQKA